MPSLPIFLSGNEECPQPQTSEHLAAVEIMRLENIIILQNKIDLVSKDNAVVQHAQIRKFVVSVTVGSICLLWPTPQASGTL